MSELIQQKKYELSNRTSQILSLAATALSDIEDIRQRAYKTKDQVVECGRLLCEEQEHVNKTLGKGSWESYCDIVFEKTIPRSTRFGWMKDYKESRIDKAGLAKSVNEQVTHQIRIEPEPNRLRKTMQTLNLFPAKKHEAEQQAGPTTATPSLSPHLSLINKLVAWHTELLMQNQGALTQERRSQLIQDFTPVLAILEALRA